MEVPIELCNSAKVYRKDPVRSGLVMAILVALYAFSIPYCINTAGEPRRIAMVQAQKLADEQWAQEASYIDPSVANATAVADLEPIEVDLVESATLDITGAGGNNRANFGDDFDENGEAVRYDVTEKKQGFNPFAYISSFFTVSKEAKRAKADFEKWQKEFKEKSGETVSLPPEYLPSAWACLALFATLTFHALFYLMGHWIVAFKAATLFKPANKVEDGCFVLITPPPNRGNPAMVAVHVAGTSPGGKKGASRPAANSGTAGKDGAAQALQVEFQRQKYNYLPAAKLGEAARKKFPNGVFSLTAYPVALPIEHYLTASGLKSDAEVDKQLAQWGKNHLAVAIPSFLELLQLQLLSPLAIFQVFCALLWLLDEYWSYTLFTLFSVVMYEATTVFQRTRTQKMLGGMAPTASPIYVYRCNQWRVVTTKDLLPGDIISLSFKKRTNPKRAAATAQAITGTGNGAGNNAAAGAGGGAVAAAPSAAAGADQDKDKEKEKEKGPAAPLTSRDEIVPCDCVLIRGKAVVNEASLTGESVPQMKEALTHSTAGSTSATASATANSTPDGVDLNLNDLSGVEKTDSSKDGSSGNGVEKLDMNGLNRVNVLFSGCSFVTVDGLCDKTKTSGATASGIPPAPDGGALAYVLRTGFGSSQGSLLQMIEFSQQTVAGDAKETGLALLLLFIFALMASGYVLKEGLRKKEKTTHELLLKCVIIITSVVPRQLPMQMAMAVNMALMALNKAGIFCTEPFRVPLAGKVSHCLFDKTGTLTTDQLVPVGIINHNSRTTASPASSSAAKKESSTLPLLHRDLPALGEVITATAETALILAACHSLVVVDDGSAEDSTVATAAQGSNPNLAEAEAVAAAAANANLVGDPIELAAIKGIDWSWDAATSTATPTGGVHRCTLALSLARQQLKQLETIKANTHKDKLPPGHEQKIESIRKEMPILEAKLKEANAKASSAMFGSAQVLQRHHFSSKLQRMSVVCRCQAPNGDESWYCLVKGSPEALKQLMVPSSVPSWYSLSYESLARRGLRVLALAYKKVSLKDTPRPQDQPRAWVESQLHFGGFIAFECKVRADSGIVMSALIQSDHKVIMITGDGLLTSLHVAKKVYICSEKLPCLTLTVQTAANAITGAAAKHVWMLYYDTTGEETEMPFDAKAGVVSALATKYNLLTTEEAFNSAVAATGGKTSPLWAQADAFRVFARMSPQGKASIIRAIQDHNKDAHVFMCGDGGNDVGALKQADVGLALLAGHANANTTEDIANTTTAAGGAKNAGLIQDVSAADGAITPASDSTSTTATTSTTAVSAEDALNAHQKKMQLRNEVFNKARTAHMKEFQAKFTKELQVRLAEEIKVKTDAGDFMGMFNVMKNQTSIIRQAMNEENQRYMAMHGQVWDPKKDGDGLGGAGKTGVEKMLESMESGDAGGLPMVRPGDASVAAPFTSRIPSVRAVVDLIRQGRCTLLSALMQQQIMMLESCIAAYTLSALSLHNARSSERQMMASSWLIMTAAISFSYAAPLDHMHHLRPLRSLFHPAIIISTLGQALIHIACMTLAVQWATEAMGPETLKEVTEFFKKAKANEIARDAHCGEDDFVCQMQAYWTAPFMPNLLNTVVFLVETSQMISVFFANYKGRPWMKGMLENHPLFLSVFACVGGVVVAAWEFVPQLNEVIQLAPFPDDAFRYKVVILVSSTILGTLLWDRLCVYLFAPQVFKASMEEFEKTSIKDFLPILMTLVKVVAVVLILSTGNLLLMGGAFYAYRTYSNQQKEKELREQGVY